MRPLQGGALTVKPGTAAAVGTLLVVITSNAPRVPLGTCRDTKTGKSRVPRPPCDKNGKGPLIGYDRKGNPIHQPCDRKGECEPEAVSEPVSSLVRTAGLVLLAYGALATVVRGRAWR